MEKKYLDLEGLRHYNGKLKNGSVRVGHAAVADQVQASGIQWGSIKIPLDNIPQGALERVVVVSDEASMYRLTSSQVQQGDTVKVTSTKKMYFVKDASNLGSAAGYEEYSVGVAVKATVADSVAWANVSGKPAVYAVEDHASDKVTSLRGYAKGSDSSALSTSDSLNKALGKLENRVSNAEGYITINELTRFPATNEEIGQFIKDKKPAYYTVVDAQNFVVGTLSIFIDSGKQLITEVLESRIIDPNNLSKLSYGYGAPSRFYRHCRVLASEDYAPQAVGTWSEWLPLVSKELEKSISNLREVESKVNTLTSEVSGIKSITTAEIDGIL